LLGNPPFPPFGPRAPFSHRTGGVGFGRLRRRRAWGRMKEVTDAAALLRRPVWEQFRQLLDRLRIARDATWPKACPAPPPSVGICAPRGFRPFPVPRNRRIGSRNVAPRERRVRGRVASPTVLRSRGEGSHSPSGQDPAGGSGRSGHPARPSWGAAAGRPLARGGAGAGAAGGRAGAEGDGRGGDGGVVPGVPRRAVGPGAGLPSPLARSPVGRKVGGTGRDNPAFLLPEYACAGQRGRRQCPTFWGPEHLDCVVWLPLYGGGGEYDPSRWHGELTARPPWDPP